MNLTRYHFSEGYIVLSIVIVGLSLLTGCGGGGDSTGPENPGNNGATLNLTYDTVAQHAEYPALALDASGNAHISFLDYQDRYVKYAVKNGSTWTIRAIAYVANSGGTVANGGLTSIVVDGSNHPHVSFFDYGNGLFKYASWSGSAWTIADIPLPDDPLITGYSSPFIPWAESSIAIDTTAGVTHIALQMLGGRSGYVLGYWKSGMGHAMIVDAADGAGYQNSLRLDASGNPCISYEERGTNHLKFARWNGASFSLETIDTIPGIYWEDRLTSLAIDKSGNPKIAYVGTGYTFKYASKSGSVWSISSLGYSSSYPSIALALDGTDKPHVALVDNKFRYGTLSGSSWTFNDLGIDVQRCAVAATGSGKIHLAYNQGNVSPVLMYAKN